MILQKKRELKMLLFYKKNRFEGYKLFLSNLEFDVWEIEKTWAFKERKLPCCESEYIERLHETVFLNIDSTVYSLNNDKLYDLQFSHYNCKKISKKELKIELTSL